VYAGHRTQMLQGNSSVLQVTPIIMEDTFSVRSVQGIHNERYIRQSLVMGNDVPSSPIVILMMKAVRSSETSVFTRATRRKIPVDDILHSHCRENFKSYIALTGWTV
jgi:hypothetical protein